MGGRMSVSPGRSVSAEPAQENPARAGSAGRSLPGKGLRAAAGMVSAFSTVEAEAMEAALEAALQGPRGVNPLVGAVVVDPDGRHVVTGFHRGRRPSLRVRSASCTCFQWILKRVV